MKDLDEVGGDVRREGEGKQNRGREGTRRGAEVVKMERWSDCVWRKMDRWGTERGTSGERDSLGRGEPLSLCRVIRA